MILRDLFDSNKYKEISRNYKRFDGFYGILRDLKLKGI